MTDAEKAVVKEAIADVEKLLPEALKAVIDDKFPQFAPVADALILEAGPAVIALIDKAIQAKLA